MAAIFDTGKHLITQPLGPPHPALWGARGGCMIYHCELELHRQPSWIRQRTAEKWDCQGTLGTSRSGTRAAGGILPGPASLSSHLKTLSLPRSILASFLSSFFFLPFLFMLYSLPARKMLLTAFPSTSQLPRPVLGIQCSPPLASKE